jgi:general stress protein 26
MGVPFRMIADDLLRLSSETVWCSLTTIDPHDRPRSRIIHPIWEVGDACVTGWLATRRSPIKSAHLAHNPHVACAYWRPTHDAVLLQCLAAWADAWADQRADRDRIWRLFAATPPPLGYDPHTIWPAGSHDPDYALLRFEAWRVQIVTVETLTSRQPRVWTSTKIPGHADDDL